MQLQQRARLALLATLTLPACGSDSKPLAPVRFSEIRVEEVSDTRAVVRFNTSRATSCEAHYGTAAAALTLTATDPDMAPGQRSLTHQVPLEDLLPATHYYWQARAVTAEGGEFWSNVHDFTTPEATNSPTSVNVALMARGTSVTAVSSNWAGGDNDSSFGVHNAFDGMMSSEWSSDGDGDDAWVEIDFGASRRLESFAYRSREMSDGTSIVKSVLLVVDSQSWGPFATPDPTQRYEFALEPVLEARRVRIEALETTGGNTGAREIEFYE